MRFALTAVSGVALLLAAACGQKDVVAPVDEAIGAPLSGVAGAEPDKPPGGRLSPVRPETLDQMLALSLDNFDRLDIDKDGRVTEAEREAARGKAPESGSPYGRRRAFGGGLGSADANNDGVITRAEVQAQTKARFNRMDIDRNGTVTPEEIKARFNENRGPLREGDESGPPAQ